MKLKQQLISSNRYKYKSPHTMTPKGLTIHNTANDAPAKNEIAYMVRNNNYVSFHIAVDDIEAIQAIPFNRNAFHAGDGGSGNGNRNYIGLEICYSKSGGVKFDKAEDNAAKVAAQILKQHGWGVNKMVRHKDHSGKNCPHRTMQKGWQRFVNMVSKELSGSGGVTTVSNIYYGVGSPHNTKSGVQKLQQDLVSLGHSVGSYGADGVMGNDTKNAIISFQKANGLTQDGFAGQATLNKIKELIDEKNKPKPVPAILYRVRKSWADAKSQKGAYASLDSAVSLAKKNKGYNVYDDKGKQVYPEDVKPNPNTSNLYRVRSTWKEEDTQKGAYSNLNNAIEECKKYKGYHVYDNKGKQVYPEINTKPIEKPKSEIKPEPNSPTNNDISISGKSIATARQMEKALLSKNKSPKIKISALEFCKLFLEEGEVEGIRGDIAFCQAMKETGWLSYGGQVLPEQNNYAG